MGCLPMEKCLKILLKMDDCKDQVQQSLREKVLSIGQLEGVMQKTEDSDILIVVAGSKTLIENFLDFCYQLKSIKAVEVVPQIYNDKLFRGMFRVL